MKATFKALFTSQLATTFKDAAVTVVNGSNSTVGYAEYQTSAEMGETLKETTGGICHVLHDEIGVLSYASVVKIGTRTVFVTGQNIDAMGVENTFTFSTTNPVGGEVQ